MKIYSLLILIFFICIVHCDEVSDAETIENKTVEDIDNKTKDDADDKDDDTICSLCTCQSKLQTLDCENINRVELFSEKEWISFNKTWPDMDYIYFDENQITTITAFPEMNMKFLSFSHNSINSIKKQAFKNLQFLEELDLSFNKLTSKALQPEVFEGRYQPDEYEPLRNLRILRLGNNLLHTLHNDVFEHFPSLEFLYLDSNPFMALDHSSMTAISSLVNLKFIDMSYMELETIPELLYHAPRQLEALNLTGNLLTTIPEAVGFAINLKYLEMDENPIHTLIDTNITLPKLEILSISYIAPLRTIAKGALSRFPSLTTLYCNNNPHLSSIHPSSLSRIDNEENAREIWPPIKFLYLQNNNISFLDSHLLGRWDNLEMIDIRMNPWSCDCENQWIVDSLVPLVVEKTPKHATDVVCKYPKALSGKKLADLSGKGRHMRCEDRYGNRPERDGAILIGLLLGLLIGIPMSFAIVLIYRRGCFGLFGYAGPGDYSRAYYKRTGLQDDIHI